MKLLNRIVVTLSVLCALVLPVESDAFKKAPLLKDIPELSTVVTQRYYRIATLWLDDLSVLGISNAAEAWSKAAGDPDFIRLARPGETPNIFMASLEMVDFEGIALPFDQGTCVISINPRYIYNISLFEHELGHCIGFAHNPDNPASVMQPYKLQKSHVIDKQSAKTLKMLVNQLDKGK